VGHSGGQKRCIEDFSGNPEGKNYLEDQDVDGLIILRSIFKKWDGDS